MLMGMMLSWQTSMVFEQQQSTYGKRKQMHNGQFGMNIVNNLLIIGMCLKVCASRFVLILLRVWDNFVSM